MSSDGPVHRVQSAVVEYGYPQGHLGQLSPDEEGAFRNFKLVCEEKGYYKPGNDDEPGTHDDATLLYESPISLSKYEYLTKSAQALSPGSPLRCTRCPEAVYRHRRLAQTKPVRPAI